MRILFLSALASPAAIDEIGRLEITFSHYAVQKFNRLVVEGLAHNGHNVTVISTFYLPGVGCGYYRKKEIHNKVHYHYVPSPNFPLIRHLWLIIFCFIRVFSWGLFDKKNKAILADALNISACIGAVSAARLLRIRCAGIMTDMPGMIVSRNNQVESSAQSKLSTLVSQINKSVLRHFTHYVFLTEHMNGVINVKSRPYIVMEGLVDINAEEPESVIKAKKRVLMYAGGLHERYGIKMLVEGFILANIEDSELWLYGSGPFVEKIHEYSKQDSRVVYKGIRTNQEVIEAEKQALLLVNPRPSHEEFTKYSFPSKNMEYMSTGTPVITTKLPGMPMDYYPYVFLFDKGETAVGYADVITRILSLPEENLIAKGADARRWVLNNKNNIVQTARIVDLLYISNDSINTI